MLVGLGGRKSQPLDLGFRCSGWAEKEHLRYLPNHRRRPEKNPQKHPPPWGMDLKAPGREAKVCLDGLGATGFMGVQRDPGLYKSPECRVQGLEGVGSWVQGFGG